MPPFHLRYRFSIGGPLGNMSNDARMIYRYFVNVGTLQDGDRPGWIGCWYIYDRSARDPLQPILSGRSAQPWSDAASALIAAYEEGLLRISELAGDAAHKR